MQLELWQVELRYERLRIEDAGRQRQLLAAIAAHGQQSPVLVISSEENRYVLIDGYARHKALKQLGRDTLCALALPMEEAEALLFGHRQARGRERTALEEGWLLGTLQQEHGLSMEALAAGLERSKSWVSRRLALIKELPERAQELVRQGKLCAYAAMRYLVPLARANKAQCTQLADSLDGLDLSARQVGRLYTAWQRADSRERQRIVERPALYLKAEEALVTETTAPVAEAAGQSILKDLSILTSVCHRLRRWLEQADNRDETAKAGCRMQKRWQEVLLAFESLKEVIEEVRHA